MYEKLGGKRLPPIQPNGKKGVEKMRLWSGSGHPVDEENIELKTTITEHFTKTDVFLSHFVV